MTTPTRTDLSELMHALADSGHARAAELREKADAFDVAMAGIFDDPPKHTVPQIFGIWAQARLVHNECTGRSK